MKDQKTRLALRIIGDHFGDVVQDVASVLTEGDKCTLPYLFRTVNANIAARAGISASTSTSLGKKNKGSALDGATVRTALMILHQHNCLYVDPPKNADKTETNSGKVQTGFLYSLNIINVLQRLNFARMLSIIRQKFGDLAMHVAEAVMLHGRMRIDQIQDHVVWERERLAAAGADQTAAVVTHHEVKLAFEALVSNRFIVTVPYVDRARSEPAATVSFADETRSSAKRAFDFLDQASSTGNSTGPAAKRSKTATAPAAKPATNRRAAAQKLAPVAADDGIPVELRMMLGLGDAGGAAGAGAKKGVGADVSAAFTANTAVRSTKEAPEAEWDDGNAVTAGSRGGRGGRGAGGRGSAGSRGGRGAGRGDSAITSGNFLDPLKSDTNNGTGTGGSNSEGGVNVALWMIGWDQYVREMRHNACVQIVTLLHKSLAGDVIRIMLSLSMNSERGFNQAKSGEVSVADLFTALDKEQRGAQATQGNKGTLGRKINAPGKTAGGDGAAVQKLDLAGLKKLLEYLRLSESGAVIKVVGSDSELGGPSYMVNMEGLVRMLQRRTIFSIASERFGFVSARIVELLQRHQYLEQQQVCDMALLPPRETRERLYKLFLDGWVNYIDLSKRADFNPSTSYYFWFLDLQHLKDAIRDHTYQAMLNLCVRRNFEADAGREVLEREDCIDNEADRQRHAKLTHRLNKLDLALLQAHTNALLMEHF